MLPEVERALHAANPWLRAPERRSEYIAARLPATWIPRHAEAGDWGSRDHAYLVIGPRQAGKSSLIWYLLRDEERPLLFLDCEDPAVRRWCHSPSVVLEELSPWLARGGTLFLDEVQHLEEAGLFVKGLVDAKKGYRILVTGSSSYHLRAKTRESLAGRATRRTLFPLSLGEISASWRALSPAGLAARRREALQRQLVHGGFPAVWLSEEPAQVLTQLLDALVIRDASDLYRIERPDAFRRLLELAAGQVGSLTNNSEWASLLGLNQGTVGSYLSILEDSHVIHRLPAFSGGKRREVTSRPKIFFIDNGLRNAVRGGFHEPGSRTDVGQLYENWLFSQLHTSLRPLGPVRLHFWRSASKAEVDFVLASADGVTGWEVKSAALRGARLSRSSRSFIEAYRPAVFTVLNAGHRGEEVIAGTLVRWRRHEEAPEEIEDHLSRHAPDSRERP